MIAKLILACLLLAPVAILKAADEASPVVGAPLEKKVNDLLKTLTLEEKVGLCSGDSRANSFTGLPRLGIPALRYCDGPRGANGGGACTAFPSGVSFGATWNPDLLERIGQVMGEEARAIGVGVLLGPGINILRDPLNGRFFEYYSEDPCLNSRLAVSIVRGIQSEGVAACVKHYACNNREYNRNLSMSMVDPRTLHEIYLPAFKASVQEGRVWCVMTGGNGVNGDYCSDSAALLNDTLKGAWGFDGMVMTDWLETRSTEKAAWAGLDVSMPGKTNCLFKRPLLDAVKAGRVSAAVIDDKARRVLRVYGRVGLLDQRNLKAGAVRNTPGHADVARQAATEGIVLLKNDRHLLPWDAQRLRHVLVLGPNADQRFCLFALGGSSFVEAPYEVTPLAGIRKMLGDDRVSYLSTDDLGGFQPIPAQVMQPVDGEKGFKALYFEHGRNEPCVQRVEPRVNFMWEMKSPDPAISPEGFRAQFTGRIIPPVTGKYTLRIVAGGKVNVGVMEGWAGGAPIAMVDSAQGTPSANAIVNMQKDRPFLLRLDYTRQPGDAFLRLTWQPPNNPEPSWIKLDAAVRSADAVIVVAGLDHSLDTEGSDRPDMEFPAVQQALINRVARQNPNTVVVLVNGSPIEVGGWLTNVSAVVEAWYPGMEGGHAIADVLFGKVDPSGRLPFSWPKKLQDSPSHALGRQDGTRVDYKEGLMVGYRYYDSQNVEPEFPFGHGLSYTTFSFENYQVRRQQDGVHLGLTVRNTGKREGVAIVQFYVRPLSPSVPRPVHELKAFRKVRIRAQTSARVDVLLGAEAFSYFDEKKNAWKRDAGRYEIQAGLSSREIIATAQVEFLE